MSTRQDHNNLDTGSMPDWQTELINEGDIQGSQSPDIRYCDEADADSLESLSKLDDLEDVFQPDNVSDNRLITLNAPESVQFANTPEPVQFLANSPVPADAKHNYTSGPFGFRIGFEPQRKLTKSTAWTYSDTLDKLYAKLGLRCPIRFRTETAPPADAFIRCTVVYSQTQHRAEVVERCLNHSMQNASDRHPRHLFRCHNSEATYEECPNSKYLSATAPYRCNGDWSTYYYEFMCRSSCNRVNRRAIRMTFTLELCDGEVCGTQSVELRVCACPGRDRRSDETSTLSTSSSSVADTASSSLSRSSSTASATRMSPKRPHSDDRVFMLPVKGIKNFKILKKLNDSLELYDAHSSRGSDEQSAEKSKKILKPLPIEHTIQSTAINAFQDKRKETRTIRKLPLKGVPSWDAPVNLDVSQT